MNPPVYILGISAFYHDSAACLVRDGEIVAAAQEERFTRKKHDASFPASAVEYCLHEAGITIADVQYVGYYEKPFIKFERLLHSYLAHAPKGLRSFLKAMPLWLKKKLFLKDLLYRELQYSGEILFCEHHESHAASSFFPSPFEEAAILTMDGVGEWATTSYGVGEGHRVRLLADIRFPHSLGLLYSAFTYYAGFRVNSGEYKLMGLAPYGEPRYTGLIREHLIDIRDDGSFRLNMDYFDYGSGLRMTNDRFHRLFGAEPRRPESETRQRDMDIARSIQEVTEEVMLKMARHAHRETGKKNLCLAGGVALNCVGNGRILREGPFENVWIQPAAGDAGGALGVALLAWHHYLDQPRVCSSGRDSQKGSYLGSRFDSREIARMVEEKELPCERLEEEELAERVARLIDEQQVVGLFQGRMEFGPRALGGRSILGDARSEKMQETINLKIKFRESFRPFAPSVLKDHARDYFDLDGESPYMLIVAPVRDSQIDAASRKSEARGFGRLKVKRSSIPAVTHVDYSARVQTVDGETNPFFDRILNAFYRRTGCPVMINTSFNIRGEPIVATPEDAYRCFMCTDMDFLVIENYLFEKKQQPHQDRFKKEDIVQELD